MRRDKAFQLVVVLLIVSIILTVSISTTQNTSQKLDSTSVSVLPAKVIWEKNYGGTGDDRAFYATANEDGYLVVGSSESIMANATVGLALKLNANGNVVWNRTFFAGSDTELRYALNLSGGFLLVGNAFSASGDVNGYVVRINNQGSLLWNSTVGGEKTDRLFSAIAAPDSFVVFGLTYGNDETEAWAIKFDANGNLIWNKNYDVGTDAALRSGVLAPDGDYLSAGYTNVQSKDNYDFYLLKIGADGNMVWNRTYGGAENEKAYSMAKAPDGYVLVGDMDSPKTATDAWIVKVDLTGNMMWNRIVGGKNADSAANIAPARDGGYLAAGFTFSFGAGQRDFWLFKMDESGQVLWSCTQGNAAFQEAYSVIEEQDNQYIMVGWTDPPGQADLAGKAQYDFYVVKLSPTQNGDGLGLQFVANVITLAGLLLAALFVLFKLRLNHAVESMKNN